MTEEQNALAQGRMAIARAKYERERWDAEFWYTLHGGKNVPPVNTAIVIPAGTPPGEPGPLLSSPKPAPTQNPQQQPSQPSEPPQMLINVKASSTAIQAGQTATQLPGQVLKLTLPQLAQTSLPGAGAPKDSSTGSSADPIQGTTGGPDNSLKLNVPAALAASFLGLPSVENLPAAVSITVSIDPTRTRLIGTGSGVGPNGVVNGVTPSQEVQIGGQQFWIYDVPGDLAQDLLKVPGIEIDWCRTKEPMPPGKAVAAVDPRDDLPGVTIHLGAGG
jgi:hypothetical protein